MPGGCVVLVSEGEKSGRDLGHGPGPEEIGSQVNPWPGGLVQAGSVPGSLMRAVRRGGKEGQ